MGSLPETGNVNAVSLEFGKLLTELKIAREGVGFYALRHSFESVGGETGDRVGVDRVMGHVTPGMGENYTHWLKDEAEDARLRKITNHVREWLNRKEKKWFIR